MTVLEAMDLLGLDDHPNIQADVELAMARALKQTPRQRELLEEAARCLSTDLDSRASRATSTQHHSTREILLFDENRDAVMFGDQAGPELPVAFQAPLVDDALWMGDDSVIFEGEAAMVSEFTVAPDTVSVAAPVAAPEPSADVVAEPFDAPPRADTSISGEWHLMLESLEAEGLVKPEEGFSDALSAQPVAPHDTPPERLAANPAALGLDNLIFAAPEPDGSALPSQHAALLETPLFSTPLFSTPLLSSAQPEISAQPEFSLETPLFASAPLMTSAQAQVITFDESLLISHGGSLTDDSIAPPINAAPMSLVAAKTLETLPSRKAPEAAQLSIKPAAVQPSEQPLKQVTGRAGIAPDAARTERRSARSAAAQPVTPRTYRDAREQPTQVRRRRQPVAVWLLSVAALLGSAVFIAPNLAAQLRDQLLPRAVTPTKPSAGLGVKPPVRVVKPAAITPVRTRSSPVKPAAQTSASKPSATKPSANKPSANKPSATKPTATKPTANKPIPSTQPSPVPTVVTPPTSASPRVAAARVKVAAPVRKAPRVTAPISSASSLPPVTRPEGFASTGVSKPAAKPVVSIKPAVKPVPKPAPPPAPVASIEYQDKPSAAVELPGGLSRQEFGRQFLNRKQFEVWQAQQLGVRFESFAQIPLETQVLEADAFRAAVLIPLVRPTRPERP